MALVEDNLNNDLIQFTISHQLFLETLLMEIRGKTISYSAYKKKKEREKEDSLQKEIENLEKADDINLNLLETKKEELENLRKEKVKGIIIRSRVRWSEEGEKPTKYFCKLESRNYINKTILKIEKENAQTITKQEEILNEIKHFYENLYRNRDMNENQDNEIHTILENIQQNPKLSNESKNNLEGELTEKEILNVLKKMKNNKSPGTDGFTTEFFKFFYNDIKVFIKSALNEGYINGKLSITQRQGLITCLPKGDKPKQFLKNWRPITLLNVIYKKVQVGKDQEKAQSEKDSHSKNRGGKKPNQQSGTYTMKHIVSRMSSYFPNRWPLSYLNLTKIMKTHIRRQQHKNVFKHQDIKQKEPPQKYRLGTISNTKLLAGLNRFYMAITSPSASAVVHNI